MKTKIALFTVIAAAILFGACVGLNNLGVLDETVPEAMRANLEIRNNLSVILYNDQPVRWSPGITENRVSIALPPGPSTFLVQWSESAGHGMFNTRTKVLSMDFLPGHDYRIDKQNIWLVFFTITNVRIRDVTPRGR